MIRLIPEQLNDIKKQILLLNEVIYKSKQDDYYEKRPSGIGIQGFDDVPDFNSQQENSRLLEELRSLSYILRDVVIIEDYDSTKVNIGTKFSIKILDEFGSETDEFILIEQNVLSNFGDRRYVSLAAPLGAAVYGKHINERISYRTVDGRIITGIITSIALSRDESELTKVKVK